MCRAPGRGADKELGAKALMARAGVDDDGGVGCGFCPSDKDW
jgi:hypothetical protein